MKETDFSDVPENQAPYIPGPDNPAAQSAAGPHRRESPTWWLKYLASLEDLPARDGVFYKELPQAGKVAWAILAEATAADAKAYRETLNRIDGKVPDVLTGKDGPLFPDGSIVIRRKVEDE